MGKRFTYRELTLVLGILVALIVIFAIWSRQPFNSYSKTKKGPSSISNTIITRFYTLKKSVIKGYVVFEELHSNRSNPY
jgi:hypothetical protein